MKLRSEILEKQVLLYNIDLRNNYSLSAKLISNTVEFDEGGTYLLSKSIFTNGLHIVESHFKTDQELSNEWATSQPHIRFFFYLQGKSMVINGAGNESYSHQVGMLQFNYLDENGGSGITKISAGDEIHHIIIKMSPEFYINLIKYQPWVESDSFHQYIMGGKPLNKPNETIYMDTKTLHILHEIMNSEEHKQNRYHFLKIKLLELLFDITRLKATTNSLIQYRIDKETLEQIRHHLLNSLDNPPNSAEIARIFALNEKQLKKDFKTYFGKPIYAYVVQLRMEKAKALIQESFNVNELATLLGYQSVSHFIKVFRKYYGHTPKEALSQYQRIMQSKSQRDA